jgi:predicted permease
MVAMQRAQAPRPLPPDVAERMINVPLHMHDAANGTSPIRQKLERPLWILALVVALVLLIACSNVANLLIARAAARRREMALRISIGAGRARLVQQVLIESALLAMAACLLGVALAIWITPLIVPQLGVSRDPVRLALGLDWRLFGFLAIVCTSATLIFGLGPAAHVSAVTPQDALKTADTHQTARRGLARLLVAAQVGFCFVVLFVAGLFLMTFRHLTTEDLGFRPDKLVLIQGGAKDLAGNGEAARNTWLQLQDRLRQLPGVEDMSYSAWSLFSDTGWSGSVRVEGKPFDPIDTYFLSVSPRFVSTMGMRLIAGREFQPDDLLRTPASAAIVNQTFAQRHFPGQNPIGHRFQTINDRQPAMHEIVGVVQDAHYDNIRDAVSPTAYFPLNPPDGLGWATMEVRTTIDPTALIDSVRREARQVHPSFRVGQVTLQSTLVADSVLRERLLACLSGFFAIVAMLLAAIGLYGVLSYSVVQRTREIGIRVALGAQRRALVRLVVADALWLIAIGLIGGLAGGWLLTRSVASLLYQVRPSDAISLILPIASLLLATVLAALPPALRATRVDPLVALRYE